MSLIRKILEGQPRPEVKRLGYALVDHAPIDSADLIKHTAYALCDGEAPSIVFPIPFGNWAMTTDDHKERVRRMIGRLGFVLDETPQAA